MVHPRSPTYVSYPPPRVSLAGNRFDVKTTMCAKSSPIRIYRPVTFTETVQLAQLKRGFAELSPMVLASNSTQMIPRNPQNNISSNRWIVGINPGRKQALVDKLADVLLYRHTRWFWRECSQGYKVTLMQRFGGPFQSKITWAGTGLIKGCNRKKCAIVICLLKWSAHWLGFPTHVIASSLSEFCKDKYPKLKWWRQRIWLWGKKGRQNLTHRLNPDWQLICFTFVVK